jgi:hypothetical protein
VDRCIRFKKRVELSPGQFCCGMAGRTEKIKRCYVLKPQICTLADRLVGTFGRLVSSPWDAQCTYYWSYLVCNFCAMLCRLDKPHSRTQVTYLFLAGYVNRARNHAHDFICTQPTASDPAVPSSLPVSCWNKGPHLQSNQESLFISRNKTSSTFVPS